MTATIVIDGRWITDEMSGIGRYTVGLLGGLAAIDPGDDTRFIVLGGRFDQIEKSIGAHGASRFEHVAARHGPMAPLNQVTLPRTLRRLRADLYHAPYVHAPYAAPRTRIVITVHDLIPFRFPQGLARSRKVRLRHVWNRWCAAQYRRADAIVTVSDFSRNELMEHAGLAPRKIHRIYNGVDAFAAQADDRSEAIDIRAMFSITGPIVSYIGRHDPYKNLETLIEAFAMVRAKRADAVLVIGGRLDSRYPAAQHRARQLKLGDDAVIFTDYLDESSRIALLHESSAFVFPSRYEGFGLPPLEAMAHGVPVVASNATAIPEVVGDAATLVDPDDASAMAGAIVELLDNDDLRARLIAAGRERIKQFTWEQCAREHLQLYRKVLTSTDKTEVS